MADSGDAQFDLATGVKRVVDRFTNNLSETFQTYTTLHYIRLVAIIGGYLLIRPYLQKIGAKYQERDHARQIDENEESSMMATGKKARVVAGEADQDDDDHSDGESWGKKKRIQQRAENVRRRKELEEREAKRLEDEDDKDIAEFLEE